MTPITPFVYLVVMAVTISLLVVSANQTILQLTVYPSLWECGIFRGGPRVLCLGNSALHARGVVADDTLFCKQPGDAAGLKCVGHVEADALEVAAVVVLVRVDPLRPVEAVALSARARPRWSRHGGVSGRTDQGYRSSNLQLLPFKNIAVSDHWVDWHINYHAQRDQLPAERLEYI